MNVNGHGGEIRVGYHTAARVGSWSLSMDADKMSSPVHIEAQIIWSHEYWITQYVDNVELCCGTRVWRWDKGVRISVGDGDVARIQLPSRPDIL